MMYSNLLNGIFVGNIDNYGVNGKRGVDAFPTQPNQKYALFDKEDDVIYFFATDTNNIKSSIRRVRFMDEPEPEPENMFVSKQEFAELKGEINNVQQSIQQLIAIQSTNGRSEANRNNKSGGSRQQYPTNANDQGGTNAN